MSKIRQHGTYLYDPGFADFLANSFHLYRSDKASYHSYQEPYSHLLSGRNITSFLEIGLFLNDDNSDTDLNAWANVFPEAKIYGADRKRHLLFNNDRISTFYVDQDSKESLEDLKKELPDKIDVILDDASHIFEKTVRTFESLYEKVADGGLYLIEDILIRRYSDTDWEQNIDQLLGYFANTGLKYEAFSTSTIRQCVDSIVLAIHK